MALLQTQHMTSATGSFLPNTRYNLGCQGKVSVHSFVTTCCVDKGYYSKGMFSKRQGIYSEARKGTEVKATEPKESKSGPAVNSILCKNCEGNGVVVCSQCEGEGINKQDYFNGRFKAGTICWLCRGKKEMLCGACNGAGFVGGFLNAFED